MKIIPENGAVLCKAANKTEREDLSMGFAVRKNEFPLYEVLESDESNGLGLNPGDIIACDSSGTKLNVENGVKYLFRKENVIGKVS